MEYWRFKRLQSIYRQRFSTDKSHTCNGPCSSVKIRSGQCTCKNPMRPQRALKKDPLFTIQFWVVVMFAFFIVQFIVHITAVIGIAIVGLLYLYFKYVKK